MNPWLSLVSGIAVLPLSFAFGWFVRTRQGRAVRRRAARREASRQQERQADRERP